MMARIPKSVPRTHTNESKPMKSELIFPLSGNQHLGGAVYGGITALAPRDMPMTANIRESPGWPYFILKRAIDIALSVVLLPLLSPIFLLAAAAIKLSTGGPVFFLQERVGRDGRKFMIIKFRSMVIDAEKQRQSLMRWNEADGPIFKMREDPRITYVGRFLRRYSIDELPQLLNVLRGEMSIVGPRPHLTREAEQYNPAECRRLEMKPGMTGLAQVSGRSDLCWKDAVALDLHYVDRWRPAFDAEIIARTFRAVLATSGAA